MLQPDDLLNALIRWQHTKQRHDKARDSGDGHGWGYYGHEYVQALQDAESEFTDIFNKLIDQRVTAALQHHGIAPHDQAQEQNS